MGQLWVRFTDSYLQGHIFIEQHEHMFHKITQEPTLTTYSPQGEEKLSTMKSTVNLNSFLRFSQLNLGKDNCCSIADIQQGDIGPVYDTMKRLTEKFPYQSDAWRGYICPYKVYMPI